MTAQGNELKIAEESNKQGRLSYLKVLCLHISVEKQS